MRKFREKKSLEGTYYPELQTLVAEAIQFAYAGKRFPCLQGENGDFRCASGSCPQE